LITGILNTIFFSTALMGASGIVFMLILLSSFTNIRSGEIPLTFLLIVVLFLAKEVISAFGQDNISQFAHIIGGICGSLFGFVFTRTRRT
jgi:rhomboid protease GluP